MSSGLYDLITVAAPSVQNTCDRSAPICTAAHLIVRSAGMVWIIRSG